MIHLFHIHGMILHGLYVQLDELEPLFEPQPVPFSFNTPAWYTLGSLLMVLFIYMFVIQLKKYNQNRYRRDALRVIDTLKQSQSNDINSIINEVNILLKQLAIHRYGRKSVAPLYGENWLKFLESKGKDTPFLEYKLLINQDTFLSSKTEKKDLSNLLKVSKIWILTHA